MVEYQLKMGKKEQEILVEANYRYAKKKLKKRWLVVRLIGIAGAIYLLASGSFLCKRNIVFWDEFFYAGFYIAGVVFIVLGIAALWWSTLGYKNLVKHGIKKSFSKRDEKLKSMNPVYRLYKEHIEVESELSAGTVSWEGIAGWCRINEWFVLVRCDNAFMLIKESELLEEEKQEMMEIVQLHNISEF